MSAETKPSFIAALRAFPLNVWSSIFRNPVPSNDLERSATTFTNFFLHIHPVKVHRNSLRPIYTMGLGLVSFFLFLILVLTGVALMFYYVPATSQAYDRMLDLRGSVAFGTILRNMHRWSAHGMVAVVFLHMCRVFFTGAYKKPREFNWVIGVVLFLLTLLLSFTGYLLPWDQLAFWAITVGTAIAGYAPVVGKEIQFLLMGGNAVGQEALLRFYVLHVAVLPAVTVLVIAVHFWRIPKDGGLYRPAEAEVKPELVMRKAGVVPRTGRGGQDGHVQGRGIYVSDRRWRKIVHLLRVAAASDGRNAVSVWDGWLLQFCVAQRADQVAEIAAWYARRLGVFEVLDPQRFRRVVEGFEAQLEQEQNASDLNYGADGKLSMFDELVDGKRGEDALRMPAFTRRRHFGRAHVEARMGQVSALSGDVDSYLQRLDGVLAELDATVAGHLWVEPGFAAQARVQLAASREVVVDLRQRLLRLAEGFEALPRLLPEQDRDVRPPEPMLTA